MLDNKQNILTFLIEHRLFAPSVSAFATLLGYVNFTDLFYLLQNTEAFQIKRLCVFPKTQVHFTKNASTFYFKCTCV